MGKMATRNEAEAKFPTARIEVPLAEIDEDLYAQRQFQIGGLTRRQAHNLKRLRLALELSGAALENGRLVRSSAESVRWLLERCG